MDATSPVQPTAHTDAATQSATHADLLASAADYARAWSELLRSETVLARQSVVRMAFAVCAIPALILGTVVAYDALITVLLNEWLHDWGLALAIALVLNVGVLAALLLAMRQWWRNLTLCRSREALMRLLERLR